MMRTVLSKFHSDPNLLLICAQPAHYLIVHPERESHCATGCAYTSRGRIRWEGVVWVDPVDGTNEDPFVWSLPRLYSYCKATGLKRKPSPKPHVMAGSSIVFADKELAKQGRLSVDTVFSVGSVHAWSGAGPPTSLPHQLRVPSHPAYKRHLYFGVSGNSNHAGTYTYSSAPIKCFKGRGSFIPINRQGQRVTMPISLLGKELEHAVKKRLVHRLPPILLNQNQMDILLQKIWSLTAYAVYDIIEMQSRVSDRSRKTQDCS